jgi:transmembrane sensor
MIRELMAKHLAGETSASEEKELKSWIDASAGNESEFNAFKKVFELSGRQLQAKKWEEINIDVDREWNTFRKSADERKIVPMQKEQTRSFGWVRIAAAILILVTAGLAINFFIYEEGDVHFVTEAETRVVEFPDGSKITLNSRSRISHSSVFNVENRAVHLEGEAFFEVTPNAQLPFIIHTRDGTVEVVGTAFNVQAYDSSSAVEVVVESGIVVFSVPDVKSVELKAGTKGVYVKTEKQVTAAPNDDVNFRSWNTRKLVFVDTPLSRVIQAINKTYHANISISADVPESCTVTVTFDAQSLDAVLRVLENTLNLTIRKDGNKTEIISGGC